MELDQATPDLVEAMVAIVGDAHVLADDDMRAGYETDWTGRYTGRSSLVVRPATTDEVAAVLRHCNDHGVVVVPQGGNTGLVGGGVPRSAPGPATIVLSLRRLDAITHVDTNALQLTAGAGTTIAAWQSAAGTGRARHADRLRRPRLGDRRRGDRHQRRWLSGVALRHHAPAGRRGRGSSRRRLDRRNAHRSGEGDRRAPLAVGAGGVRGHPGGRHGCPPAVGAPIRARRHGDAVDGHDR